MSLKFRPRIRLIGAAFGLALAANLAAAQAPALFRIATGGAGGTYHAIGTLIAKAVSTPPWPMATAIASSGSVANINAISSGTAESGFVQADVAYWAYSGTGVYEGRSKVETLRAIANLYPESVQLVVRRAANVKSISDLKGKRVSLDEPGSGTLLHATAILTAFGVEGQDFEAEYVKADQAAAMMGAGAIDAFFFTGGFPTATISALAATGTGIDILPIAGAAAETLARDYPFFTQSEIPAGTYEGVGAVKTLAVGAHWVTSSQVPADTVYAITKALWSDRARAVLDAGHAKGKSIQPTAALTGLLGVPLHPGAERFYREAGLLK